LAGWPGNGRQFPVGRAQRIAPGPRAALRKGPLMDILYLLIPLSVVLVFFILGGLWWAIHRGQFEDIEAEGERILKDS
jgi:cbb3-type cytochrome oxidase maturation protein